MGLSYPFLLMHQTTNWIRIW